MLSVLSSFLRYYLFLFIQVLASFYLFVCLFVVGGFWIDQMMLQHRIFFILWKLYHSVCYIWTDGINTTHCSRAWMVETCAWCDWAFSEYHSGMCKHLVWNLLFYMKFWCFPCEWFFGATLVPIFCLPYLSIVICSISQVLIRRYAYAATKF